MLRRRPDLNTAGTWLFVVVVVGVVVSVALSFAINIAADDVREQVALASGQSLDHPRTPWGPSFSAWLAPNVNVADREAAGSQADDLDHRADRIRELAAAGSLAGILLMLATARPEVASTTADRTRP